VGKHKTTKSTYYGGTPVSVTAHNDVVDDVINLISQAAHESKRKPATREEIEEYHCEYYMHFILGDEEDYKQLTKMLRGQSDKPKRITMSFNPIIKQHWLEVCRHPETEDHCHDINNCPKEAD